MQTICNGCKNGESFPIPITMAFQPIVNVSSRSVYAHEALVRGSNGESAYSILSQLTDDNRYAFDQRCRTTAIEMAADLNLTDTPALLSINIMPNAVYEPHACIRRTLMAAERVGFPLDRIIFEFNEAEKLDAAHVLNILTAYKQIGFKTAIDDFGSGFANLALLADFQPDILKLEMALIRGIDTNTVRQTIARNLIRLCNDLGIAIICEGVETRAELDTLRDFGVDLFQGYFFSKPVFEGFGNPMASLTANT